MGARGRRHQGLRHRPPCAALVAANRRSLCNRKATVEMDGGELVIEWRRDDDHVLMTGPVAVEFTGVLPAGAYA